MAGAVPRLAFKALSAALAVPIGRAIRGAVEKAWQRARPNDPPHNPREVQTDWRDAIIFALLTAFGTAIAQVVTTKGADTAWRALTGKPSPRPKQKEAKQKEAKQKEAKTGKAVKAESAAA